MTDAGVARDDLPHPVHPVPRRAPARADRASTDRAGDPTPGRNPAAGWSRWPTRDPQHLRTTRRSRRPGGAWPLGGRPSDLLVFGKQMSPVATLVERSTRFVMLVALPDGHKAHLVADALAAKITTLPAVLTRTLTWDQGHEMAQHARFTEATGIEVYFCDPKSPVAARQQRKHQRTAPPVPTPHPRLPDPDPGRLRRHRRHRRPDQRTPSTDPSASRHHHKHWPRCCVDDLSPHR